MAKLLQRLAAEFKKCNEVCEKEAPEGGWFNVQYNSTATGKRDKRCWLLTFAGPECYTANPEGSESKEARESPYRKGTFIVKCSFPAQYPTAPPKIQFQTKIYHPNINESGEVCTDFWKTVWKPKSTVLTVLQVLRELLASPNPADPLVSAIGTQMTSDLAAFERTAEEYVTKYASAEGDDDDDDDSDDE